MNQRLSSRTPGVRRFCSVILHFCPQNHSQPDGRSIDWESRVVRSAWRRTCPVIPMRTHIA